MLKPAPYCFIGSHHKIQIILDMVNRVADTDATILITGESGTGKEVIARMLHRKSARHAAALVTVNCGAITKSIAESEIFGHVKGAFTGAANHKIGYFEAANGGTIFLDEISEMKKSLQVKVLRILQSGEYTPVGSTENRYCDTRVIAAANRELLPMIAAGKFRQDLYYRLNIIHLKIPPLRERKSDIPLLVDHFLKQFGKPEMKLCDTTFFLLQQYDYPGNVRELENIIRRLVLLCRGKIISSELLPVEFNELKKRRVDTPGFSFHDRRTQIIEEFEYNYFITQLEQSGGIISRAAKQSGLNERNFREKLKKYGICWKKIRAQNQAPYHPHSKFK